MRKHILTMLGLALLSLATALSTRAVVRGGKDRAAQKSRLVIVGHPTLKVIRAIGGPGTLEVEAMAFVRNTAFDQSLVWQLRAFDLRPGRGRGIVWQRRYDEQVFVVPRGLDPRPTFSERLVLPPGAYDVEISLHAIGPGADGNPVTRRIVSRGARVAVR